MTNPLMTNPSPDPRYGITVIATEWLRPADSPYTQEEWDAAYTHPEITMQSTLHEQDGYSKEDVMTAYRWSAGLLSRAAVVLHGEIDEVERARGHRCSPDGDRCGLICGTGLDDVRPKVDDGWPPEVVFAVPAGRAPFWVRRAENLIAGMVAADLAMRPSTAIHEDVQLMDTPNDLRPAKIR